MEEPLVLAPVPSVTEQPIPIEHQDTSEQQQQQEPSASEIIVDKPNSERTESDTGKTTIRSSLRKISSRLFR